MGAFGNKTYQHSSLIAKKEIEDRLSERISSYNDISHYDFVQNDNHQDLNRVSEGYLVAFFPLVSVHVLKVLEMDT